MKSELIHGVMIVVVAVGGLSIVRPAAADSAQDHQNFGTHVSQCAHAMGGFSGDHNPSMMHRTSWAGHVCEI